jgi:putative endonuclease
VKLPRARRARPSHDDDLTQARGARPSGRDRTALGRRAELAVADYLVALGYRILARNLRIGPYEIDVVARRGPLVVAVEVRTRGPRSFERAFESIGRAKQRRMLAAADRLWREHLAAAPDVERVRVDVAAVTFADGETRVEYVESAVTW